MAETKGRQGGCPVGRSAVPSVHRFGSWSRTIQHEKNAAEWHPSGVSKGVGYIQWAVRSDQPKVPY